MKVAILEGGLETRLLEETELKPKPMVEIGWMQIIWHILKIYSHLIKFNFMNLISIFLILIPKIILI